jgi:hypothetical protein
VSFSSVAADRLEAARGTRAIVLRTRWHIAVNRQIHHVGIEIVKVDSSFISFLINVVGADYLVDE